MIGVLWAMWRWRLWIAALALAAVLAGGWLAIRALKAEAAMATREAAQLRQANADNLASLDRLRKQALKDSVAAAESARHDRERAEKVRVITKTIIAQAAAQDCPVSPAIDAAIDGAIE